MMLLTHSSPVRLLSILSFAAVLLMPASASAYLLPEEVLWDDYYVPPRSRDVEENIRRQMRESAERRESEWEIIYAEQHPLVEEEEAAVEDENAHTSAEEDQNLSGIDLELLRTLRLLERIDARQEILRLDNVRFGAPVMSDPLAPTGAGSIFAAAIMIGAMGWTLRRAGKHTGWSRRVIR